jgi:hypothetical protein
VSILGSNPFRLCSLWTCRPEQGSGRRGDVEGGEFASADFPAQMGEARLTLVSDAVELGLRVRERMTEGRV